LGDYRSLNNVECDPAEVIFYGQNTSFDPKSDFLGVETPVFTKKKI